MRYGKNIWCAVAAIFAALLLAGCQPVVSSENLGRNRVAQEKYQTDRETESENTALIPEIETEEISVTETMTENVAQGKTSETLQEGYAYQTLSAQEQTVYNQIYQAMDSHEEKVAVDTFEPETLDHVYRAVNADHGEIFWVSGYVYTQYTRGEERVGLDFAPQYTMDKETREQIQTQIDAVVFEILQGMDMGADDYQKALGVFEYLATNVDYELGASENQNIISVFLNKKTVCQGYANATQYLLTLLGIKSSVVTGMAQGESHAWNLALLDGEYYYIDTTWGNSTYNSSEEGIRRFINYNYFAVTTEEIERTHQPDGSMILPDCTAMVDNYYIREQKYITEWNPDVIGAEYARACEAGSESVAFKFAGMELYEQAKNYFIEEQHIRDYCAGISSLYYLEDASQYVLILNF